LGTLVGVARVDQGPQVAHVLGGGKIERNRPTVTRPELQVPRIDEYREVTRDVVCAVCDVWRKDHPGGVQSGKLVCFPGDVTGPGYDDVPPGMRVSLDHLTGGVVEGRDVDTGMQPAFPLWLSGDLAVVHAATLGLPPSAGKTPDR
jgi:hypothetical protein